MIELLVVIGIMSILMMISVPLFQQFARGQDLEDPFTLEILPHDWAVDPGANRLPDHHNPSRRIPGNVVRPAA